MRIVRTRAFGIKTTNPIHITPINTDPMTLNISFEYSLLVVETVDCFIG